MDFPKIPEPLKVEHDALHSELVKLTELTGEVGRAARKVAEMMQPHLLREEEYALPPLGLLRAVADGKVTEEMRGVVALTDRLRANLPQMLAEHHAVAGALDKLAIAGQNERHMEAVRFAEALKAHHETEEQILYPAVVLIGEYLKTVLGH